MRIGVMPVVSGVGGGIYQYSRALMDALEHLREEALLPHDVVVVVEEPSTAAASFEARGWTVIGARPPGIKSLARRWILRTRWADRARAVSSMRYDAAVGASDDPPRVRRRDDMARWWRKNDIGLMIYPVPNAYAFEVDVPSVVAVHDLQHRLQPEFPEVSADGEFEQREHLFANIARHARLILVDSEVGREDVLACYDAVGATADGIFELPFVPPPEIRQHVPSEDVARVRAVYDLPERFAFYPAAFWPHKNHMRLVEAIAAVAKDGMRVPLVLVGSAPDALRKTTYDNVRRLARELDVMDCITYLGFVPEADMAPLYSAAAALLFPTFFGPTNIPVIEAWYHGVPVLTSDIRGIREQCGDAAVLVDPTDVQAIAAGIRTIWTDEITRRSLVANGHRRLDRYTITDHRTLVSAMLRTAIGVPSATSPQATGDRT